MSANGSMQPCLILSRDHVVAQYIDGIYKTLDAALAPLYLKRTENFPAWLRNRAIDSHRANGQLLKRLLGLTHKSDEEVVLYVHAAVVTDGYWVKPLGSPLTYEQIRFRENPFAMVALKGDTSGFVGSNNQTPELTNIGSFEKCWQRSDDHWDLIKSGSMAQLFSEVLICEMGKALGYSMAEYKFDSELNAVRSKDFTAGAINFEDALGYVGDIEEDFMANYLAFQKISEQCALDYARMIYLDAIVMNYDRHIHNYGILRSVESGEILSLAPNFDNNNALLVNSTVLKGSVSEGFIKNYEAFFADHRVQFTVPREDVLRSAIRGAYEKTAAQFKSSCPELPNAEMIETFILLGNRRIEAANSSK